MSCFFFSLSFDDAFHSPWELLCCIHDYLPNGQLTQRVFFLLIRDITCSDKDKKYFIDNVTLALCMGITVWIICPSEAKNK